MDEFTLLIIIIILSLRSWLLLLAAVFFFLARKKKRTVIQDNQQQTSVSHTFTKCQAQSVGRHLHHLRLMDQAASKAIVQIHLHLLLHLLQWTKETKALW